MPWLLLILFGGAALYLAKTSGSSSNPEPGAGGKLVPEGAGDGAGDASGAGDGARESLAGGDASAALAALLGNVAKAGGGGMPQTPSGEWYVKGQDGITRLTPAGKLGLETLLQNYVPSSLPPRALKRDLYGYEGYSAYAYEDRTLDDRSGNLPNQFRKVVAAGFAPFVGKSDIEGVKANSVANISVDSIKPADAAVYAARIPDAVFVG